MLDVSRTAFSDFSKLKDGGLYDRIKFELDSLPKVLWYWLWGIIICGKDVPCRMATYKILWIKKDRGLEHADELMQRVENILNENASNGMELDKMMPTFNHVSNDLLGVFLVLKHA